MHETSEIYLGLLIQAVFRSTTCSKLRLQLIKKRFDIFWFFFVKHLLYQRISSLEDMNPSIAIRMIHSNFSRKSVNLPFEIRLQLLKRIIKIQAFWPWFPQLSSVLKNNEKKFRRIFQQTKINYACYREKNG